MSRGESVVDLQTRAEALEEAIAIKERRGFRVESQSGTEARVIRLGRKRWLGIFGGRLPETREILRVDERGRTTVEQLPPRRY
jgi:hypothetical protein